MTLGRSPRVPRAHGRNAPGRRVARPNVLRERSVKGGSAAPRVRARDEEAAEQEQSDNDHSNGKRCHVL